MDQYPAKLSQPHPTAASPPPDCGVNPALHEPLPYPPTSFDPQSFTCITPPYGSRAAPLFAECCDSPVLNFTTVHLTSEGPSSCAAYCNVKPDRLLVSDYQSSDFYTCVFGGPKEDKDVYVQLECWDGEGLVGGLDWADRFAVKDGDSNLKKRNAQENTDAPASSSVSTTTYDPSFWSSLISAAATETASIVLPTEPMTPVLTTTPTATAANGTAASSSDASLASGTFVSVSEVSGTRTSTTPAETSASATSGATSSGGSSASSSASASAAASSSTSGAGAQFQSGYGKWLCTGLLLSVVFASLQ